MRLQGKRIATLVAEGVEDLEYYVPLMRLQEEGAQVLTAALELKPIHGKNGLEIKHIAHKRGRATDTPTALQVFQCFYGEHDPHIGNGGPRGGGGLGGRLARL